MSVRFWSLVICLTATLPSPNYVQAHSKTAAAKTVLTEAQCVTEARWPLVNSAKYKNASVRTRRQLENGRNPEVDAMKRLCRIMSTSDLTMRKEALSKCQELLAIKRSRKTVGAAAHAAKVETICQSFT